MRHVVWCSATLSLGAFFYVLTVEPMDETQNPRAAALDRVPSRSALILQIRRSLRMEQLSAAERQSRALVREHPEDLAAVYYRALVMEDLGRDDDARSQWALLESLAKGLDAWKLRYTSQQVDYYHAWALMGQGRTQAAQTMFMEIADGLQEGASDEEGRIFSPSAHYNLACYRSMAGQIEAAMFHWKRAIDLGYGQDEGEHGWWMVDPDLEPLHYRRRFWEIGSNALNRSGERSGRDLSGPGEG